MNAAAVACVLLFCQQWRLWHVAKVMRSLAKLGQRCVCAMRAVSRPGRQTDKQTERQAEAGGKPINNYHSPPVAVVGVGNVATICATDQRGMLHVPPWPLELCSSNLSGATGWQCHGGEG